MVISRGYTSTWGGTHIRFNLCRQTKLKLIRRLFLQIVLGKLIGLHGESYKIDWDLSLWLLESSLLISYYWMLVLRVRNDVLVNGGDRILLMHKMVSHHHLVVHLWINWHSLVYIFINLLILIYLTASLIYLFLSSFIIFIFYHYFINILLCFLVLLF